MTDGARLLNGFAACATVVVAALWYGALAPRDPEFDTTTVLEGWRSAGLPALGVATAALAALLLSARAADFAARAGARAIRGGGAPYVFAAAALWLIWSQEDTSLSGDAVDIVQRTARGDLGYDHPLSGLLFLAVHRWTGADAWASIRFTSSALGTVYVLVSLAFALRSFADTPRRLATVALLLTAGCVALFSGSIEIYAPPALACLVFLVLALRRFDPEPARRGAFFAPAVAFGVFAACHGIAVFAAPAAALLLRHERRTGAGAARVLAWCGAAALPVAAALATLRLSDLGLATTGQALDTGRFLPLVKTAANVQHRYAILDAEHLAGVLAVLLIACPAAWCVLCAVRRPPAAAAQSESRGDVAFLAAATVPLVALPFVWNLAYTVRRDWDLFSLAGVPLALLAVRTVVVRGLHRTDALRVTALAWFAFVPFVVSNSGDASQRRDHAVAVRWALAAAGATSDVTASWDARVRRLDPRGVTARLDRALAAADAGRTADAEALAREVLAVEPENVHALTLAGEIRAASATDGVAAAEAEDLLRRAIAHPRENLRPRPRLALARLLLTQGRKAEARAQLDRLVREDCQHPVAGEALTMLADLVHEAGDPSAAASLRELAARRGAR